MDGPWAEGAIRALLERLSSAELIDLFQRQRVEDGLVEKLKTTLLSLDTVLNDAQEKQGNNPRVGKWVHEVTETLYRTEDVLGRISTEALLNKLTNNRVGNLRWEIEMDEVNEMMDAFVTESDELGLIGGTQYDTKLSTAASSVDESEVVFGRESDKEAIIDLLMGASEEPMSLIVIVAKDGMGKTTLARLVYDDHKVSEHFDLKAWAWVPAEGSVYKACQTIIESNTFQSSDPEKNRFLIVLDDVSSKNTMSYWNPTLITRSVATKGSCIIVTTPDPAIESIMRSRTFDSQFQIPFLRGADHYCNAYDMNPLSDEECWSIFTKFAFGDENHASYQELEVIGRQIVKVCHGLPLTVRTLGAFLRSKLDVEMWGAVLNHLKHFHLSNEMTVVGLALRLSYDHLPAHLKRCFAYCSIFPFGYEFEKEKLVHLWMAEGLLPQPEGNRRIEEVGDDYFNELLFRSFFQQSSGNKSHFVMHSLTNELARSVSGRFCFILEDLDSSGDITLSIRYLSIFKCKFDSLETFDSIRKAEFLRTYLTLDGVLWRLNSGVLESVLSRLEFLRVLSLSHYEITKVPVSISNLKQLRYIDLSHTKIESLPESVCFLPNLQTLILSKCHSLTELPQNMGKLINLRHLNISGTNLNVMPKEMGRLESLQTLSNFVVGKESGSTVIELRELLNLHGKLCISKLQNIVSAKDAAEANLVEKTHLDELVLEWGDNNVNLENDGDVLEQLVPHTNLKKLSISFYSGTRFPHWLGDSSFSNMFFLHLCGCNNCIDLPPLGQLPSLKVLIIESMNSVKQVGPEFYGMDKPFQSLETLTFDGMLEWEKWIALDIEGDDFPCLRQLCIRGCPKLKGNLPNQLPSAVKVEVSGSQELLTTLMTEASLHKRLLDYHNKILFISNDKVASFSEQLSIFTYEGAVESSFPISQVPNVRDEDDVPNTWQWDFSIFNVAFLCLSNCQNLDLPPLGQLPFLRVLIIEWMTAVKRLGPEFYGMDKPFQSLVTLTFEGMLEWEEWVSSEAEGREFPCLEELYIRRCPKLKGNLPKQLPSIVKVEISESQELVTALMMEASLHKSLLDYHYKILFKTGNQVASFLEQMTVTTYVGATKSSIPMTQGALESSLPITAAESSLPMTQGAAESTHGAKDVECSLLITQNAAAAESSLPMIQGDATAEYSSAMTQDSTESSLPMTQDPTEPSFPVTQTPNSRNEVDVPTNTLSNQDGLQDLFSFKSLKVSEISQLRKLPIGLHSLKIEGCDALEFIPEQVMASNPPIQHLYIISCCSLKYFPGGNPPTALKFLYIQNCKKLKFLPPAEKTRQYALLEHLCIGSSCDSLLVLPLDLFPKLKILSIWDCANLESLSMPERIQKDLTSLEALEIRDCPNLLYFPKGGLPAPNLKSIWFSNCKNLKELPDQLHTLSSLRSMFINNCPELVLHPEGGLPSNLSLLCITYCDKLMPGMEWGLHRLDYLSRLEIEGACKNVVSFPEAKLLPRNLNSLRISGLLDLKYLNYRGLQHLTALKILEISCCNKLQSLPEEGLPASLSFLCIKECSLLKPKLQDKTGKYWSKIAHISCIEIDEEVSYEEF